MTRHFDWLSVG